MPSSDTLNLFSSLPRRVQRVIDDAFNITHPGLRPSKRRKISVEPNSSEDRTPSQIPLDAVPTALQRLDLPPDDEEVLSVFRNASSGWASSEHAPPPSNSEAQSRFISREDWRAVCAVLLENRPGARDRPDEDEYDVGGSSDEYVVDDDDVNSEGEEISGARSETSEDEYLDGPRTSSRRRKGKLREEPEVSFDELKAQARDLTHRQRRTCLDTYALFFPHVSASELADQRIAIKDIQRVAKLLNEKLKAEEVGRLFFPVIHPSDQTLDVGDVGDVLDFTRQNDGL